MYIYYCIYIYSLQCIVLYFCLSQFVKPFCYLIYCISQYRCTRYLLSLDVTADLFVYALVSLHDIIIHYYLVNFPYDYLSSPRNANNNSKTVRYYYNLHF